MHTSTTLSLSAMLLATITLSACNSSQDQHGGLAATGSKSAARDANVASANQFKASVALHGAPVVSADGKSIVVTVDLGNDGSAILETKGINPINLGAHSIDAKGNVISNDLARASLSSPIAPKNHALVNINLPIDKTIGYSVQILPVQENVSWFDKWGTKPLVVGPFNVCSDNAQGKVCDASGEVLSTNNN